MAEVKIEDLVDHLDFEMKRALEDAVNEVIPGARFDRDDIFARSSVLSIESATLGSVSQTSM